jgi:hypothetical protein
MKRAYIYIYIKKNINILQIYLYNINIYFRLSSNKFWIRWIKFNNIYILHIIQKIIIYSSRVGFIEFILNCHPCQLKIQLLKKKKNINLFIPNKQKSP